MTNDNAGTILEYPVARIRKDWADSLNAASANSLTVLAELIDGAMVIAHHQAINTGAAVEAQSKILSMAVADGLARIGAEYNVNKGISNLLLHHCGRGAFRSGRYSSIPEGSLLLTLPTPRSL